MALPSSLRTTQRAFAVTFFFALPTTALAQQSLHERVDQAITAALPRYGAKAAPAATDAEFLRRVYLDLTGTIPTAAETRAFLNDGTPDKRSRLIDRLL